MHERIVIYFISGVLTKIEQAPLLPQRPRYQDAKKASIDL